MNEIHWAVGGEPPNNLPPGNYKVYIVDAILDDASTVTVIRYIGPA